MSNATIRQFGFELFTRPRKAPIPVHPHIVICLERWGSLSKAPSGPPTISPDLMSEGEIDTHIEALKADLDRLAVEAKKALRKAVQAHLVNPSAN